MRRLRQAYHDRKDDRQLEYRLWETQGLLLCHMGAADAGLKLLARAATFQPPFEHRWEAVPSDLGTHKNRAEADATAWKRWIGPSELLFTQRAEAGRQALATAGAQAAQWDVRQRQIWL